MNSASFRVIVYTKNGERKATKDHKMAHERKYMADPSDWRNVEFTGYFRVHDPEDRDEEITIYTRSGRHTNGKKFNTKSCTGTAYKPGLEYTGKPTFKKEYWHSGGYWDAEMNTYTVPEEEEGSFEVDLPQTAFDNRPDSIVGK